jgi:flagellar hook-length control protein FliK
MDRLMSAVSSSTSTPSPEPASRRRAAEREAGGEAAPFSLPGDAGEDKGAAAGTAKTEAGGQPAEPGKAQASKNAPAVPVVVTQATPAPGIGTVASPPAEAKPEQTTPKQDAATLFAIAVAAQGPAKDAEAKDKPESAEAKEPVPNGEAAATVDATTPGTAPAPAAVPAAPPPIVVAATIVTEAVDPVPAAKAAIGMAVAAPVKSVPAGGEKSAVAATALPLPADASAIAVPETDKNAKPGAKPDPAVAGMAKDAAVAATPSATGAAAPDDFKPLEALQQVLAPIDLSALAQPRGGRPEALPGQPDLEQAAAGAQSPATAHQRGMADGQPTPLHVVPIEIGLRALAGSKRFDIRLDPAELGRVDVNLEISEKGEVSARLVVDRVETLHLLQRDARTLERAFEQAGLKAADGGVDITLRDPADQSGFRQNRHEDEASRRALPTTASDSGEDTAIPAQPAPVRRLVRLGGVDLSI